MNAYKASCDQGWASGPQDGYFFSQLTRHLKAAGQVDELRQLLFDYGWLRAQLNVNGINSLLGRVRFNIPMGQNKTHGSAQSKYLSPKIKKAISNPKKR